MARRPTFDIELPPPRVEPSARWVRVRAGDATLADSRRALLLTWYGPGRLPTYCLPAADVRMDLLIASAARPRDGAVAHDVRTDGGVIAGAARLFSDPPKGLERLRGHWTFTWDGRVSWLEEALEVHVHARDPRKRVDAVPSERHVRIELDGVAVADSRRPLGVFETSLPTRWYLSPEDVDLSRLEPSPTVTRCPYKGTARYWSVRTDEALHRDAAWSYPRRWRSSPARRGSSPSSTRASTS